MGVINEMKTRLPWLDKSAQGWIPCQVSPLELFCVQNDVGRGCKMLRINPEKNKISAILLSVFDQKRFSPTLIYLPDQDSVLLIGGRGEEGCLKDLSHHKIADNRWTHGLAKLNTARRSAGGTYFKGHAYVVAGYSDDKLLSCVERINTNRILNRKFSWEHLSVDDSLFRPTYFPSVAPLNDTQIVLFGGIMHCDITIFDTTTNTFEKVGEQCNFKIQNLTNQTARVQRNKVIAMVQTDEGTRLA